MAIRSFADKRTADLMGGVVGKGVSADLAERARARLIALHAATAMDQLKSPGADLKILKGEKHDWQMRVTKQYRIRFNVASDNPFAVIDVAFGDFH